MAKVQGLEQAPGWGPLMAALGKTPPSPQDAANELLNRRLARSNLLPFITYVMPSYTAAAHHKLICEKLEAVERGEIKRLMIAMPPRHGKSQIASRMFPAWYLGRNPGKQIISASYNSDLATDFGRDVRNLIAADEYPRLFNVALAQDSRAANKWHTDNGGQYIAAGVGTAITGRGADIALIDDAFRDWYTSTLYTRLMPGAAIVVIGTRWHDDDLSGRLLAAQAHGGDKWEVLNLPAISDDNEALWPEWYPLERLEQIRAVLPARDWNSLYQQNPVPDDGEFFKKEWLADYQTLPKELTIYGASDYAVTSGGGDWTEHGVFGVDQNGNIYILDWWRGQTAADVWINAKCDLIIKHKPKLWFGEAGPIRRSIEPFLNRRMQERNALCRIEWLTSIGDKESRARGIQALASMGKLWFPANAPWKGDIQTQMLRFPAGAHDDAVDVMGMIGRGLQSIRPRVSNVVSLDFGGTSRYGWMS
ncbi:MAG: phage terminase large subunit [Rhodoferax sp.]|nr:phage terminase large subunit [Rhodoferax sp.]